MNIFGLIGYPLSHSFSKKYFTEKFEKENIPDCRYELFELKSIQELPALINETLGLRGLNVTIPYKQEVKQFLDGFDPSAEKVGAVNVIKINHDLTLSGFNSDYYGFKVSLDRWLPDLDFKALVLGSGGASKAVTSALTDLNISYKIISRSPGEGVITYKDLEDDESLIRSHKLIINTTPVGMSPNTDASPPLKYELLDQNNFLYDLVYNPEETLFMVLGKARGAKVKNGIEMLHLQAEKSWEIWNG
jgi:shikimate dehydrogenase